MRNRSGALLFLVILLAVPVGAQGRRRAVNPGRSPLPAIITISDDFRFGTHGWVAAFADYAPVNDANGLMELASAILPLPPGIDGGGTGFMITGHNRSDDLFMFLTRKLTRADGIHPGQRYEVSFDLVFASNAGGEACAGIGGHPGFSVFLKAGASGEEPRVELDETGHYRVTVDKGNQATDGPAASLAGNISTGSDECSEVAPYKTLAINHHHRFVVQANAAGELWLLVGTDSGFEGKTTLYYQSIRTTLRPVS